MEKHKGGYGFEMKKANEPCPIIVLATKEEGMIVDSKVVRELFFVVKLKSGETKDFKFNEVKIQEEKK